MKINKCLSFMYQVCLCVTAAFPYFKTSDGIQGKGSTRCSHADHENFIYQDYEHADPHKFPSERQDQEFIEVLSETDGSWFQNTVRFLSRVDNFLGSIAERDPFKCIQRLSCELIVRYLQRRANSSQSQSTRLGEIENSSQNISPVVDYGLHTLPFRFLNSEFFSIEGFSMGNVVRIVDAMLGGRNGNRRAKMQMITGAAVIGAELVDRNECKKAYATCPSNLLGWLEQLAALVPHYFPSPE